MTAQDPLIHIVIITYDGKRFLGPCFRSLLDTCQGNIRVILVDNGSIDGSSEFVRSEFPEVEVLRLEENVGRIGASNHAIRHVLEQGADYIVLGNDDIELIDDRWLAEAVAVAERNPRVGIVGFTEVTSCEADKPDAVVATEGAHVVGFLLLMRAQLLENVGDFDAEYLTFADETDLQARAALAGYQTLKLNLPVYHAGGGTLARSSRKTAYLQMYSGLRFCLKLGHPLKAVFRTVRCLDVACNPWPFTFDPNDAAHNRMRNTGHPILNLLVLLRALFWNVASLPNTLRSRRRDRRKAIAARNALMRTLSAPSRSGESGDNQTECSDGTPEQASQQIDPLPAGSRGQKPVSAR